MHHATLFQQNYVLEEGVHRQSIFLAIACANLGLKPFAILDGPAIRNSNRGDSRESIRGKKPVFVTCER